MHVSTVKPVKKPALVMLVDDHPLYLEGLVGWIRRRPGLEVCGTARSVKEALTLVRRVSPDLALVDLTFPEGTGMDLIRDLKARRPSMRILVVSMHDGVLHAEGALGAGAHGYVCKSEPTPVLEDAIRRVLSGEIRLSEDLAEQVVEHAGRPLEARLSRREREIFEMIGRGMTTGEIARRLKRSVKTIQAHRSGLKRKLHLRTAAQLSRQAAIWVENR